MNSYSVGVHGIVQGRMERKEYIVLLTFLVTNKDIIKGAGPGFGLAAGGTSL